jgi:hypothetical protein
MICCVTKENIYTTTCDHPVTTAVVEVRPSIRSVHPESPAPGPVGKPVILAAIDMKPVMVSTRGPTPTGPATRPKVLSAKDLKPVITEAEEE